MLQVLSSGNLRGAKSNRGLLTREKWVSPAVRPRSGGTMRPCRAQPLSSRLGLAVKGLSSSGNVKSSPPLAQRTRQERGTELLISGGWGGSSRDGRSCRRCGSGGGDFGSGDGFDLHRGQDAL